MSGAEGVAERLHEVRERVARAARRAGREPDAVTVVGVAKRQPAARVAAAVRAGLGDLGENYVQEAAAKARAVEALLAGEERRPLRWHLVGRLQRNKARDAVRRFDLIQTLDRVSLALELERHAAAEGRSVEVLLQVNLCGEKQKGGVAPGDLPALVTRCAALGHLHARGLMTIPAVSPDPAESRPAFARLRGLRDELAQSGLGATLRELSMGMSDDFEVAIEEGATIVRIGTAIFGPREERA